MKHTSLASLLSFGPSLICIAAVLWGLDGVLRRSLYTLPPAVIVLHEHLIGAAILAPFVWLRRKELSLVRRQEWVAVVCVALLSGLVGTLLFTSALASVQYISFSVVYLVQKLQPLFVVATSAIILRERPVSGYWGFALLALLAGYFVTFPYGVVNMTAGAAGLWAALLALGAAVAWGSSTAISRYTLMHHDTTLITALRFLFTVPLAFGAVVFLGHTDSLTHISSTQILLLCAIACSTGMVALWIYYKGLQKTPATTSAILELTFPMTAVAVDYFLYNTVLTLPQIIAALVLIYAAYNLAERSAT